MEDPQKLAFNSYLILAMLLDDSLLDFTSARAEVIGGNGWDRGVTRIVSSGSSQLINVASGVEGPRFLELFLSRILEK